jgi:hypothetical protein
MARLGEQGRKWKLILEHLKNRIIDMMSNVKKEERS